VIQLVSYIQFLQGEFSLSTIGTSHMVYGDW